jgi:hypothetical protein
LSPLAERFIEHLRDFTRAMDVGLKSSDGSATGRKDAAVEARIRERGLEETSAGE